MIRILAQLFMLFSFITLISCQKELSVEKGAVPPADSTSTDTTAKGSYLPLTKDTYWRYSNTGITNDTSVVTMLGISFPYGGINYQAALSQTSARFDTAYYAVKGHDYYLVTNVNGNLIPMLILNDSINVNDGWTLNFTLANAMTGKCTGKIVEKNTSLPVNGNTYQNVIHTSEALALNVLNTSVNFGYYDFYFAKDIGIIRIDFRISTDGTNYTSGSSTIIDYQIK